MTWFPGTYTGRFNRRHKRFSHLLALEEGADIVFLIHQDYRYTPKLVPALVSLIGNDLLDRIQTAHQVWIGLSLNRVHTAAC